MEGRKILGSGKHGKKWNPMEVEKSIKELKYAVENLEYVFEMMDKAEEAGLYSPLVTVTYGDIVELSDKLTALLKEYEQFLNDLQDGRIMYDSGNGIIPYRQSKSLIGKNAPAYKHNINERLMYQLYKDNISINEIARRVGCSPDTVKRRIYKMKQNEKEG